MLKEVIATGATIDEAREKAVAELCADENTEVKIEVLELPVKKTLGLFGGAPAKVRAYYEVSPKDSALAFLKDVMEKMGMTGINLEAEDVEGGVTVTVTCDDNSVIIGRHGETLDALQYLSGLVANKTTDDNYFRVSLNTGSYREKREKSLSGYARKVAISVAKTGKSVTLEPMNPYERRIIHTAVQGIRGANSYSVGEGADRKVVICLEEGFKPGAGRRDGRGAKSFSGNRGGRRGGKPYEKKFQKKAVEICAEQENREPHSDLKSAPLYGRVERMD